MTDLGARHRALEEELAWTAGERDIQRAAAEQKAQEAEAQTAELQRVRTALEQKEAEEKGRAFEEKEVAIRNAEATLKEKKDSLSSLKWVARVQQEEAQKNIAGECSKFHCRLI